MHTPIWARIGTNVPQAHDIFRLKPCGKTQEPRALDLADWEEERTKSRGRDRGKRVYSHGDI